MTNDILVVHVNCEATVNQEYESNSKFIFKGVTSRAFPLTNKIVWHLGNYIMLRYCILHTLYFCIRLHEHIFYIFGSERVENSDAKYGTIW